MSDQFELSEQLMADVKATLQKHDSRCSDDMIASQYLSALVGFVLAHQHMAPPKKRELLGELNEFAAHVLTQVEQQSLAPPPAADAFGIWRPGDS